MSARLIRLWAESRRRKANRAHSSAWGLFRIWREMRIACSSPSSFRWNIWRNATWSSLSASAFAKRPSVPPAELDRSRHKCASSIPSRARIVRYLIGSSTRKSDAKTECSTRMVKKQTFQFCQKGISFSKSKRQPRAKRSDASKWRIIRKGWEAGHGTG